MGQKSKAIAFNFYSSDFLTGTLFMSDDEVGKYIRLMCTQHQHGHLDIDQMQVICKGPVPPKLMAKYVQDEEGKYYNVKLEEVISKKAVVVDKLKDNLKEYYGKSPAQVVEMKAEEEKFKTESPPKTSSTPNAAKIPKAKSRQPVILKPPSLEEVEKYFTENGFPVSLAKRAWQGYEENNWIDSQGNEIKNWKLKMQQVWFKDEHKIKTGIVEHGQRPGQNFVSGQVPASYKK